MFQIRLGTKALALLLGLFVLIGCEQVDVGATLTPAVNFQQYENRAAFDMLYPSEWRSEIVQQGLIAFARPEQLDLAAEQLDASLVVFRQESQQRFTLEEEFLHYLDSGPTGAGFELADKNYKMQLGGKDSFSALVVNDSADFPTTAFIISTRTGNLTYTFTATAPTDSWDFWWQHFEVMLSSVTFNE